MFWGGLSGIVVGIGAAFPLAMMLALTFRFPVPFAGYQSGVNAVLPAIFAVVMYGLLGGFVVIGGLGATVGIAASKIFPFDPKKRRTTILLFASGTTLVCLMILATLDWIIGPW